MNRVLVVEDQADLARGLVENLEAEGYEARACGTARDGALMASAWPPDLIILDLMLPDCSGEVILADLRARGAETPVLILSARSDEATKVQGFRLGADDYVTKPFGLLELLARVANLLRRKAVVSTGVQVGRLTVFPGARRVLCDSHEVELRPKELDLLLALLEQPNRAVSRRHLLKAVWGYDSSVESRTVDWHVAELRRKLEADPSHPIVLRTVRKVGYRLDLVQSPR